MNEAITCFYQVGMQAVLPTNWQGDNLKLPDSKLYYVSKGELVMKLYGSTMIVREGDMMLIPANTVHSCCLTESRYAELAWCHFTLNSGQEDYFKNYEIPPLLHVEDRDTVSSLFQLLFSTHTMEESRRKLISTTAICSLVDYYFLHSPIIKYDTEADRIRQVITYIDEHYTENITVQQLAQLANYSESHLSKRFHDVTGMPPMRYLSNVRIKQAKLLLQFSDEPVCEIMERCGFMDAAYFSRVFKKVIGYSPQVFRKLYLKSENGA